MATLKMIKKNYDVLTMPERFSLYQKALLRRDKSELGAIYTATPMKKWEVIDFYFLREEVFRLDALNMLARLGHYEMFETFARFAADAEEAEKVTDYYYESSSLSAYLYVIETDAWQSVCEELGFEADYFRTLASELSFAVQKMNQADEFLRECAFSVADAQTFLAKSAKRHKQPENLEVKTLDEMIVFYRGLIECV